MSFETPDPTKLRQESVARTEEPTVEKEHAPSAESILSKLEFKPSPETEEKGRVYFDVLKADSPERQQATFDWVDALNAESRGPADEVAISLLRAIAFRNAGGYEADYIDKLFDAMDIVECDPNLDHLYDELNALIKADRHLAEE